MATYKDPSRRQSGVLITGITFFLIVLLSGCGRTTTPNFRPLPEVNTELGLVYVFRRCLPNREYWSKYQDGPFLHLDNKKLGFFPIDTYVSMKLEPGSHTLTVTESFNHRPPKTDLQFGIKAGQTKYIEYVFGKAVPSMVLISDFFPTTKSNALSKIQHCQIQTDLLKSLAE